MNMLPEWDNSCVMCGCKELVSSRVNLQEEVYSSKVCSNCYAVFVSKDDNVNFMGFLPEEMFKKISEVENPIIKAAPEPVSELYGLN